jgi:hypothetical protein
MSGRGFPEEQSAWPKSASKGGSQQSCQPMWSATRASWVSTRPERSKCLLHAGFACFQGIDEVIRGARPPIAADHEQSGAGRGGRIGSERLTQGRQIETQSVALGEDAKAGQRAQKPVQGWRMRPQGASELLGAAWPGFEMVGLPLRFRPLTR